jgi:hypothetical protein
MKQPGLGGEPRGCGIKVKLSQGVEQVAGKDDPLALPPRKAFAYEMIDPAFHRISCCDTKSGAADLRTFGNQLSVDPGRSLRRDLSLNTEIRSRGKREMLASLRIVICPRLHDRAGRSIAGHFDIGESDVMRSSIDALDDRIG